MEAYKQKGEGMKDFFKKIKAKVAPKQEWFDYDIEADKGEFVLKCIYGIDENLFLRAAEATRKKLHKHFGVLEKFEAHPSFFGALGNLVKKTIAKAEKDAKSEGVELKIVSWHIDKAVFEKKRKKFYLTIKASGVCTGD